MTNSMTGFAGAKGDHETWEWSWEIRSVNARGLDIRMRVPDWIDGLDGALRPVIQKAVARGSVSLSLRVTSQADEAAVALNAAGLSAALDLLGQAQTAAEGRGLVIEPARATDILAMRGVLDTARPDDDPSSLTKALAKALPDLLKAFNANRAAEGQRLAGILAGQVDTIADLTEQAAATAETRTEALQTRLRENLARVLDNADGADPDRVAQELAVIAVKSDVTEEIDRLRTHVAAARDLLGQSGPVGRKLDFLMQEFNREANTLCSKAQSTELTAIGLDMKVIIDQMREQVQNVE